MKNRIKICNKVKPRLTVATKKLKKAVSMNSKKGLKKATKEVTKTLKDADNLLKDNLERISKDTGRS